MNIMILGSMTFAEQMMEAKKALEAAGHEVEIADDIMEHIQRPEFIDDLAVDLEHCIETDILRSCFRKVENSDAVVMLNYEKNGIPGYVGTSCLMELAMAHYFNKKIFLLNPVPPSDKQRWAHEVRIFQPVILHGDLEKIS